MYSWKHICLHSSLQRLISFQNTFIKYLMQAVFVEKDEIHPTAGRHSLYLRLRYTPTILLLFPRTLCKKSHYFLLKNIPLLFKMSR